MENLETVIKNASRRMKITNKEWIGEGCNVEYKPKIYIYENGYIVGMYHQSASPQFSYTSKKVYGKELGEGILNFVLPNHVLDLKVEDIIDMVHRQLDFVGYQN